MKRKKKSKTRAESNHFAIRCLQRLGYIPDENAIIKAIQNGELTFLDSYYRKKSIKSCYRA